MFSEAKGGTGLKIRRNFLTFSRIIEKHSTTIDVYLEIKKPFYRKKLTFQTFQIINIIFVSSDLLKEKKLKIKAKALKRNLEMTVESF